ncbi:MAG: hypothetical protein J7L54_06260 [Elusimicrobia bacterium]|nr:hypothetical protein [Elusimicrobiota bacterium]
MRSRILSVVFGILFFAFPLFALSDIGVVCDFSASSTATVKDFTSVVASDNATKATFVFSWKQMENLRKNVTLTQAIKKLILAGRAEILSGVYFDIDFVRAGDDILYSQIKRFKLLAESIFGEIRGICPTELRLKNSDLDIIQKTGFNYALVSERFIPPEFPEEKQLCQPALMNNGVILYPVSEKISGAASEVLVERWEDNFKKLLGSKVSEVSNKVPSSSIIFVVNAKDYTASAVAALFRQIEDLKLRMKTIGQLSAKEPPYFSELGKIMEPDKSLKTFYQKILLAEWKAWCGKLSEFPEPDEVIKLGAARNFSEVLPEDRIKKIVFLKNKIYKSGRIYEFEFAGKKVFVLSNDFYRIYFSDNLDILFIVAKNTGGIIAGRPFSQDLPAFRNFFNYNFFDRLWQVKIQEEKTLTRLSARLTASPFEIKKTFVVEKNRNLFKFYCSVINSSQKGQSCDISFEIMPARAASLFLNCGEGQFYGSFQNVSKEFNDIDRIVFPFDRESLDLKFFGNFPFFLSSRAPRLEFVYPGKTLSPGERFLFEIHFAQSEFKVPPETSPLFEFSDIVLDGQATEDVWKDAFHAIDPLRDGAEGCDIGNIYFISKKDRSYLYLDGKLSKISLVYLVHLGKGPVYLKNRMFVPDNIDYYVKIPRGFGYPAAYKWDKLWFATFEKGFSFSFLKNSCEIRLPWPFRSGRWAVYLKKNDEVKDVAYFTVP